MKRIFILGLTLLGCLAPVTAWAQGYTPGRTQNRFPAACATHPSARGYADMVTDWTTGNVYLFGGLDHLSPSGDYLLFDVWSYNPFAREWKLLVNSDAYYNAFQRDAVALDPESRKVVLFSTFVNCDASGCGVETWIYDIRSNTFENVRPSVQPSLRWGSRMVYDVGSKQAILFGGSDGYTAETLNDTWAYDFKANTWTEMRPSNSPPPHHFAAMTYNPLAGKTILFGGFNIGENEALNDTWAYDAKTNAWTDLNPASPPPARLYHTMAWDIWSNRIIMFGGVSMPYEPILGDTWAFDLKHNTWTKLELKAAPSPRAWQAMEGTWVGPLLFGGSSQHDVYTATDTWNFNSMRHNWVEVLPCKAKNRN